MSMAVRGAVARASAGALLALGLALPGAAQDDSAPAVSAERVTELRAAVEALEEERIALLMEGLLEENDCTLSMTDEAGTDAKIIGHFAAALEMTEVEAMAVRDRLQDRISPVSRAMVEDGRVVPDVEGGVVWLRDCVGGPEMSTADPLAAIPLSYNLPGAGVVRTERVVALVEDHFEAGGCTLDFSDPEAGRQGIVDTVAEGIGLAEPDRAAARPALDGAMRDIFGVLVPAGKVIVDEAAMTVSLKDCNG